MSSTIQRGLCVLEALARSDAPRGISELAKELDLDKSAVQRVFQTLFDAGYLERAGARYRPSLRLWEIGSTILAKHEVRRLIHPILRSAAHASRLTAFFALVEYPEMLYVDKVEGELGRPASSEPGERVPMRLTASGKAVLAHYDGKALRALDMGREKPLPAAELRALEREFALIRQRSYAASEGGTVPQVNSIAAAVWGPGPLPVGSIALTSDAASLPVTDFERVGRIAMAMAEQATAAMGGRFPATRAAHAP